MGAETNRKPAAIRASAKKIMLRKNRLFDLCHWCGGKLVWVQLIDKNDMIENREPHGPATFRYREWTLTMERATVEHILPIRAGGGNDPENLAPSCYPCNNGRDIAYPWKIQSPTSQTPEPPYAMPSAVVKLNRKPRPDPGAGLTKEMEQLYKHGKKKGKFTPAKDIKVLRKK